MARGALIRQNLIVEDLVEGASKGEIKRKMKFTALNLPELIDEVSEEFKPLLKKFKLTMSVQINKDLPVVNGNNDKIKHALRNLLSNAVKFNREGGKINIKGRATDGMVEVCVSDTGVGIPKDELGKIFDWLYQIDSSAGRTYGGTGMGLSVAKEIVEAPFLLFRLLYVLGKNI